MTCDCHKPETCIHIRQDVDWVVEEDEYIYKVTYVDGHAVLTAWSEDTLQYETMVVAVGEEGTLGEVFDMPPHRQRHRVSNKFAHYNWDYVHDAHAAMLMAVRGKMLETST